MMDLVSRSDDLVSGVPSSRERLAAAVVAGGVLLLLIVTLTHLSVRFAAVPAFVPFAGTFLALPLGLTAVVFFNQFVLTRSPALAVLGAMYLYLAIVAFAYVLDFPGVFGANGLFANNAQAAGYLYNVGNVVFGLGIVAYTVVAKQTQPVASGRYGRVLAGGAAVAGLLTWFVASTFAGSFPELTQGTEFTTWQNVVNTPVAIVTCLVALEMLRRRHLRTTTDLWLAVVMFAKLCQVILTGGVVQGRYSAGWYFGRVEAVIASVLILAVFLVRLNGMTVALAARNRDLRKRTADDAAALEMSEARYRLLAESLPQLVFTLSADGRLEYANARMLTYTGIALAEAIANGIEHLIDERDRTRVRIQLQRSMDAGENFDFEFRLRNAADAEYRWFLCRGSTAQDQSGRVVRWFGTLTEIEMQKRAAGREAFLASSAEQLGASLDATATVRAIARAAVPELGIWAVAQLLGADDRPGIVASSSDDPASWELVAARIGTDVAGPVFPLAEHVRARLALGEHAIVLDPALPAVGRAVAVYPLAAGDEVIGILAVVVAADFGERAEEAALGRAYARRAALALERARLFEQERRIADTLQRAMLPAVLPAIPGLTFSAAYSAASESERVGGDFYDAFLVPDGRVAIVIGDVTGHGLDAAVTMGEVRQSIRAAAFETGSPSRVLDRASRLFVAGGRDGMVTAVFSLYDPVTHRLTYATAGHPAPLLRSGSTVERLGGEGLPLGLRGDTTYDATLDLAPGSALAFFTDGLIEFDRDVVGGERLVETTFAETADVPPERLAAALRDGVLAGRAPSDDIAVLTMTLAPMAETVPERRRSWRFVATDRRAASLARRGLSTFAHATLDDDRALDAELVYGELLANVVQHAPGLVEVTVRRDDEGFRLVVEDRGRGFTYAPNIARADAESGRGWAIIARLASAFSIERLADGTRASITIAPGRRVVSAPASQPAL